MFGWRYFRSLCKKLCRSLGLWITRRLGRPAVGGGAIRERASTHGEHAPGAQPSVKVGLHDPEYRQARNDCCGGPCPAHRRPIGGQIHTSSYPEGRRGPVLAVLRDSGFCGGALVVSWCPWTCRRVPIAPLEAVSADPAGSRPRPFLT